MLWKTQRGQIKSGQGTEDTGVDPRDVSDVNGGLWPSKGPHG